MIDRISFFDEFECLKGDCPVACCHGWKVPIDPESVLRYRKEKGKLGLKLRLAMKKEGEFSVFNPLAFRCRFYTKDGLCGLQMQKGESYIPGICRRFPRRMKNYGYFAEESLELACPMAAGLFLRHRDDLLYHETDEIPSYPDTSENDDRDYLFSARKCRNQLIARLQQISPIELFPFIRRMQKYAKAIEIACVNDGILEKPADPGSVNFDEIVLTAEESHKAARFLFSALDTDQLMCHGIYHVALKRRLPLFYQICLRYFEQFDELTIEDADSHLEELFRKYRAAHPDIDALLRDYLIYYLQNHFLQVYEDYSYLRMCSLAALHVHFLFLFFCLYEPSDENDIAVMIATYERHMHHNDDVLEELWKVMPKS